MRREEIVAHSIIDDDSLLVLVNNENRIIDISNKQRGYLQTKYLYLHKLYELALQHMDNITWKQRIVMAISELEDDAIFSLKNEKTVRQWNIELCLKEQFKIENRAEQEPNFFEFFPESKT